LTLKFHPSEHHPNVFFCGTNQKKIFQFDLRTGQKTMEYTQHLGAVNTLTFIEENKFVSSSDDKKLFIWEYGVPVVTRHVSEP
jgi:pre-mRNA-processing factor 17